MAVWWMFREPSLGRHMHREFMRNAVLDLTLIIPATACHQRNYVARYSRFNPQYPQDEGPGLFATLTNPYAFATAQVRYVLRTQAWGALPPEDFEDAVQDALLWAWERRHCAHLTAPDFPGYISAVIRGKLRRRGAAPTCREGTRAARPAGDATHAVAREQRRSAKGAWHSRWLARHTGARTHTGRG